MSALAKITLLFVVFVDLIGQGLVFPIINGLIMEPTAGFLPATTSQATRHFDYGLVIGIFFLSWFLGVVYVARLSDAIGRKNALLVCLSGALIGYLITILALFQNSLGLLILGRAVTGFTAGNQPIAQAAMIDGSSGDADRDRNMGYIVTGISVGMVAGPIMGAVLSDPALLGRDGTFKTPFYAALSLTLVAIVLVLAFFRDVRTERTALSLSPLEIFSNLWRITQEPIVIKIMPVYTFFMIANVTFYIFVENYLTSAYGYGVIGGSIAMLVVGIALATSSTFLVKPAQERLDKKAILLISLAVMTASLVAFVLISSGPLSYLPLFLFYFVFGVSYPTLLGLFSSSVSAEHQGWVMGVSTAVFCLAGGVMSLTGGWLMGLGLKLPFYIAIAAAVLALLALLLTWGRPEMRRITARPV